MYVCLSPFGGVTALFITPERFVVSVCPDCKWFKLTPRSTLSRLIGVRDKLGLGCCSGIRVLFVEEIRRVGECVIQTEYN